MEKFRYARRKINVLPLDKSREDLIRIKMWLFVFKLIRGYNFDEQFKFIPNE